MRGVDREAVPLGIIGEDRHHRFRNALDDDRQRPGDLDVRHAHRQHELPVLDQPLGFRRHVLHRLAGDRPAPLIDAVALLFDGDLIIEALMQGQQKFGLGHARQAAAQLNAEAHHHAPQVLHVRAFPSTHFSTSSSGS
jgi:hypothetical protein